jgi:threonine synthase
VRGLPSGGPRTVAAVVPTDCPRCGSSFLQPLRCEARAQDALALDLRCSECGDTVSVTCTKAEVRELDRLQAEWRREIVSAYERSVAEAMDALATCLGTALERDLIGADDFAPRRFARPASVSR